MNRGIADRLRISVRTAEVHRYNLMKRMQAGNVAQLLYEALSRGVLPKSSFFKR
jgi:FixJ family two-component response regulator